MDVVLPHVLGNHFVLVHKVYSFSIKVRCCMCWQTPPTLQYLQVSFATYLLFIQF